jgi:MFS transporter, YNFM family, putative membrane transport protein
LADRLEPVLGGLVLVGAGTFFAQAVATGFVGRAATTDRASASDIYLACYYVGGVAGSAIPGALFQQFGWPACVAATAAALLLAVLLGLALKLPDPAPLEAQTVPT